MAVLRIRQWGDPVLRARANEVDAVTDIHRVLVTDMLDTMRDAPGVGLAGPQVGVTDRVFVYGVEEQVGAVFNPMIVARSSEMVEDEEGCLSLPGLLYPVERHESVTVEGLDENGQAVHLEGTDLLARVFQHEIDHLDGVLFVDRLSPKDRKDALAQLRDAALGLIPAAPAAPADATL